MMFVNISPYKVLGKNINNSNKGEKNVVGYKEEKEREEISGNAKQKEITDNGIQRDKEREEDKKNKEEGRKRASLYKSTPMSKNYLAVGYDTGLYPARPYPFSVFSGVLHFKKNK